MSGLKSSCVGLLSGLHAMPFSSKAVWYSSDQKFSPMWVEFVVVSSWHFFHNRYVFRKSSPRGQGWHEVEPVQVSLKGGPEWKNWHCFLLCIINSKQALVKGREVFFFVSQGLKWYFCPPQSGVLSVFCSLGQTTMLYHSFNNLTKLSLKMCWGLWP